VVSLSLNEERFQLTKSEKLALAISLGTVLKKEEAIGGYETEIKELIAHYIKERECKGQIKILTNRKNELEEMIKSYQVVLAEALEGQDKPKVKPPINSLWISPVDPIESLKCEILQFEEELRSVNDGWTKMPRKEDLHLLEEAKKLVRSAEKLYPNDTHLRELLVLEQEKQVKTSFEQKFDKVTNNLHHTSKQNLIRLVQRLASNPQFEEYLEQANKLLSSIENNMQIAHETPAAGALSILRSGKILSMDELIRREILPIDKKDSVMTFSYIDGLIGEQDAVFFSIKPDLSEKPRLFDGTIGIATDVTFVLDKKQALEQKTAYFTPFAFGMGLERPRNIEQGYRTLKTAIPLYRNFVFQGFAAYKKLLLFSIADTLRFETLDHSDHKQMIQDALKPIDEFPNQARSNLSDFPKALHLDWSDLSEILKVFDYDPQYLKSLKPTSIFSMKNYFEDRFAPQNSATKHLFAYQGFPVEEGIAPPLLSNGHDFWELKIPREVSLELVSEIRVRNGIKQDSEVRQAIFEYAKSTGREIEEVTAAGAEKIYRFINTSEM